MKKFPKVNFIGNKEQLASWICDFFPKGTDSVLDLFAGGGSVGYEAKKRGFQVFTNDILKVNAVLNTGLIENSKEVLTEPDLKVIFRGKPKKGFMYKNYANVYFFSKECQELDQYRANIAKLSSPYKKALALSLMRRAMVRKMPYSRFTIDWKTIRRLRDEEHSYKEYGRRRAYHNQSFKEHFLENLEAYNQAVFSNGKKNKAYHSDAFALLGKISADIVYLDPPYSGTMNNYFGFYGVLDEYIQSKRLEPFNNNFVDRKTALKLFDELFSRLAPYKYWMLSYNNASYPKKDELLTLLRKYSKSVTVVEKPHRYKLTGKQNKDRNREYLFIVKNPARKR